MFRSSLRRFNFEYHKRLSSAYIDTIFALSSGPIVKSGVSVIRISGPSAKSSLEILTGNTIRQPRTICFPETRKATVRKLFCPKTGELIDKSVVLWFPGPKSFTGEDIVELHVHGSRAVIQGLFLAFEYLDSLFLNSTSGITCLLQSRIRPAEPGEFTRRAFENGKMDLTEVEGLADLLAADTILQRRQALSQMQGHLKEKFESWRHELLRALAHTEAVIDFGDDDREDDIDDSAFSSLLPRIRVLRDEMKAHLGDGRRGELVREGVEVALVGLPNAGKSSLLNALARRPAAIVSPIAGTTRDIVEVRLDLGGVGCVLRDTAGIREDNTPSTSTVTDLHLQKETLQSSSPPSTSTYTSPSVGFNTLDLIEVEGINRARSAFLSAQIKVVVMDVSDQKAMEKSRQLLSSLLSLHLNSRSEERQREDELKREEREEMRWRNEYQEDEDEEQASHGGDLNRASGLNDSQPTADSHFILVFNKADLLPSSHPSTPSHPLTSPIPSNRDRSSTSPLISAKSSAFASSAPLPLTSSDLFNLAQQLLPSLPLSPPTSSPTKQESTSTSPQNNLTLSVPLTTSSESPEKNPHTLHLHLFPVSSLSGQGVGELETGMSGLVRRVLGFEEGEELDAGPSEKNSVILTRERHRSLLRSSVNHLETFLVGQGQDLNDTSPSHRPRPCMNMDAAAEELRLAMQDLGRVTGRVGVEELLDVIFRDFCIGK